MEKEIIKVSVIIPVYNVERYLDQCLESIVDQTEKNIEIICIDDCSTDGSWKRLEHYANRDRRFQIFTNQIHSGQAYSRNAGLDIAKGEYIFFVDSDDYIEKKTIEEMYNAAAADKLDLLFCDMKVVSGNSDEKMSDLRRYRLGVYENEKGVNLFQQMVANQDMFGSACGILLRRSFLQEYQLRFREGILHEDVPFIFKAIILSQKAGCINYGYYHYVQRMGSTMHSDNLVKRLEGLTIAYLDMLSFWWEQREKTFEINQSIGQYIDVYYKSILGLYSQVDKKDIKNPLLLYLSDKGIFEKNNIVILESDLEIIKKSSHIVIYGAGDMAKRTLIYLQKKNIHVDAFIVTKAENNRTEVDGIQVLEKDKALKRYEDAVFIIGVSRQYREEIYSELKKCIDEKKIVDIYIKYN